MTGVVDPDPPAFMTRVDFGLARVGNRNFVREGLGSAGGSLAADPWTGTGPAVADLRGNEDAMG